MYDFGFFTDDCRLIRQLSPVVHNITNYVAMNLSANALLAIGASPVMSSELDEMEEIASKSDSLVINIGCLEHPQIEAMERAAMTVHELGRPWVLDPVGAGLSRLRHDTAMRLIETFTPSVIRANASEIMALSGVSVPHHGVDSVVDSLAASDCADAFAARYGVVVSVGGEVDYVTDGNRSLKIANGSKMMSLVTAMGCTASAVTAAFLAVRKDAFIAAAHAMALMGVGGELAARQSGGPGSFAIRFIDTLATLHTQEACSMIRYE